MFFRSFLWFCSTLILLSSEFQVIDAGSAQASLTVNNITITYDSTAEDKSRNATFQCDFQGDPQPDIQWSKEQVPIENQSNYYIQTGSNSSFLTIIRATVSDIGNYSCNATNNQRSAVATSSLNVIVYSTITEHPNSRTIKEGESIQLNCSADGTPSPSFTWMKNQTFQIYQSSRMVFSASGRNLQIKNATRKDAGNYSCTAFNGKSVISSTAALSVQYIDKPSFNLTSNNVTLVEKSPFSVKCTSTSLPAATFKWISTKDNVVVSISEILSFNSINRTEAGLYFCNATNAAGFQVSDYINMTVQYIDKPSFNLTSNNVTLVEKSRFAVKCHSTMSPTGTYQWISTKDNVIVSNSEVLSFNSINRTEARSYFCIATNAAGFQVSDNLTITVQFIDKPSFNLTTSNNVILVEQSRFAVKCTSTSLPAATFKWISTKSNIVVSYSEVLSFHSINRTREGSYFCNATNAVGFQVSDYLNITVQYIDKPSFNLTSNNVKLVEKSPFAVKCHSTMSPTGTYQWISTKDNVIVSNSEVLSFNSINRTEAESYFCKATNAAGFQVSDNLTITVHYIDNPILNISETSKTLNETSAFHIKCSSLSLPFAKYLWFSDSNTIVSDTNVLSFGSVNRTDDGKYFCNVSNVVGSRLSLKFHLVVQYIDEPVLNVSSNQLTRIEGNSLHVKCSSASSPSAAYSWRSNSGRVISNTDVLSFNSIHRNDSEPYVCVAKNDAGFRTSKSLVITVNYIDKPSFNLTSNNVTLVEKSPFAVKCHSTMYPTGTYQWISTKDNVVVSNSEVLSFNSINRTEAGSYFCKATNAAGIQVSDNLTITVQYIDAALLDVASAVLPRLELSPLRVECSAVSLPTATFQWFVSGGSEVSDASVLEYSSIRRSDAGVYYCIASNAAGSRNSTNITIDVQYIDRPQLNTSSAITKNETSSLYISCSAQSSPSARYKWTSNTGKVISETNLLAFSSINRNDTCSYTCNATNIAGSKTSTTVDVTVQYIDNPVLNSSQSVPIKEGSSLHITCSSQALPAASYLWTSNSNQIVGSQSLISFDSIRRNQSGSYVCTATNAAGSRVSMALVITVYYLDTPVITPSAPTFISGNNAELGCSAVGYPSPSFSWHSTAGSNTSGNSYTWTPIYVNNAGDYICSATNTFGVKRTSVKVTVDFSTLENDTIVLSGSAGENTATFKLKKFSNVHGTILYYQVIVLKLATNMKPWTPTDQITQLTAYSESSKNDAYITAEFSSQVFSQSDDWDFTIGNGQSTNKSKTVARFRRSVTEYLNKPLDPDSYYSAFYRGYVSSTRFTSSSWSPSFKTKQTATPTTGLTGGEIAGIVVGVIVTLALIALIAFFIRRRQPDRDEEEKPKRATTLKRPSFLSRSPRRAVEDPREPVAINRFEGHVTALKANGGFGFSQEYSMISKELRHPYSHSTAPINSLKNRYTNIHAYDHSRVMLKRDGNPGSDYINANYIDGFNSAQEYIATQGPLPETIDDFWRMVWEQNTHAIVMLTRCIEKGRPKCAKYWPSQGSETCRDLVVSVTETLQFPDHVIRTFHLTKVGQAVERTVKQFHFTGWPDQSVPEDASALFSLLKKVNRWRKNCAAVTGPLVVHCSAGVGRTGTYIGLDTQINRVMSSQVINIFENVTDLRDQRCWMVQTEDQYAYLHHALLEFIKSGDTEIPAHELRDYIKSKSEADYRTGSTGLMDEFISLAKSDVKHTYHEANRTANQAKNRYKNVYPYDNTRVQLTAIAGQLSSDYINASYVHGYVHANAFIATQAPLPNTFADFWRMIWETKSRTVVMVSNEVEAGKVKVNKYWPEETSLKLNVLIVELLSSTDYTEYTLREIKITNSEEGQSRVVRQFQYTAWPENSSPESAFGMIDLIGQVSKWNTSVGSMIVTVHCSAGVGRTGLFIALTNLIERLKTEAVVDVYQAVRKLRQQRTAMVQTREQYEFCYRALLEYLDSFDHYANFE